MFASRALRAVLPGVVGLLLIGQGVAHGATASMAFLDAAGANDPVVNVGRTAVLSGNAPRSTYVWVKYRAAGGAPCAPSFNSDSGGDSLVGDWPGFYGFSGRPVNGDFRLETNGSWSRPGAWMFCIWLADESGSTATAIAQTVTFRTPRGTISTSVNPVTPSARFNLDLSASGSTESPQRVFVSGRPAGGAPCAPTPSADSGSLLWRGEDVNGAFSLKKQIYFEKPGRYLLCSWLIDPYLSAPIAGPQPLTVTVVRPCVVPQVTRRLTITKAMARLRNAGCQPGTVTRQRSTRRRGDVVRFSPKAGTTLTAQAFVRIVVSKGR